MCAGRLNGYSRLHRIIRARALKVWRYRKQSCSMPYGLEPYTDVVKTSTMNKWCERTARSSELWARGLCAVFDCCRPMKSY